MTSLKRYLLRSGMIVFAVAIATLFAFTATASASATNVHRALVQETPVGTWNATVSFVHGSAQGQQESATQTFAADGTLSEKASGIAGTGPVSGTGTWNSTSDATFHYTFNEPMYDSNGNETGYVHVVQDAVLLAHGTSYVSEGTGIFTLPDGTPVPSTLNYTVTYATLVSGRS